MHSPTEQQFLHDVANHEMHILHEDGVYRHVRFRRADTGCMHFDLITYPGYLVYSGDMGCFVFSRLPDMFEFFRADREYAQRNGKRLAINLSYWSEKLQAVDGNRNHSEGAKEFDEDKFNRNVMEHLINWIRENRDRTTKEERRDLWEEVIREVIEESSDEGGCHKQAAAHDFYHTVNPRLRPFEFRDFWELDNTRYTYRFVWCCYALAWGIAKYDAMKEKP